MTTHAIIVPWPLSQGIRTWCAHDAQDPKVKDDTVATSPERVDCPGCIQAMIQTHENLSKWLPRIDASTEAPKLPTDTCQKCQGTGDVGGNQERVWVHCPTCGGQGVIPESTDTIIKTEVELAEDLKSGRASLTGPS